LSSRLRDSERLLTERLCRLENQLKSSAQSPPA
jgi:hypothetical protein